MRYAIPRTIAYVTDNELEPEDDRVYLVVLPDGRPVILDGSAAIIWRSAADGVADVPADVADLSGQDVEEIRPQVEGFLAEAVAHGLLDVTREEPDA